MLNQCAKAKDAAAVAAFWDKAAKRGDIPGAYWAVLTHPATTHELVKRVFGEVHMLSHHGGSKGYPLSLHRRAEPVLRPRVSATRWRWSSKPLSSRSSG